MLNWLEALQGTELSQFLQVSSWAYPAVETIHILSLGVLVGSSTLWDLHLLGFFRNIKTRDFKISTLSVARWAFFFTVFAGLILFASNPVELSANTSFRIKMLLILTALANIAIFHSRHRKVETYGRRDKVQAIVSLILWISIVTAGRWIAYVS